MTKQNIFNLIKNNHNIPDDCLRIKHIQTGREFYLGSSGAEIDKTSMTEGNFEKVKKFPKNHWKIKIMLGLGKHQSAFI